MGASTTAQVIRTHDDVPTWIVSAPADPTRARSGICSPEVTAAVVGDVTLTVTVTGPNRAWPDPTADRAMFRFRLRLPHQAMRDVCEVPPGHILFVDALQRPARRQPIEERIITGHTALGLPQEHQAPTTPRFEQL